MASNSLEVQKCIEEIKHSKLVKSSSFNFSFRKLNDTDLITIVDEFHKAGVSPKELSLLANNINDVSPLKDFDLLTLDIRANPVEEISALASQTNLLTFRCDAWTVFTPISSALSLTTLECGALAFSHLWENFYNLPNLLNIQFYASVENNSSGDREHTALIISREIIERNKQCLLAKSEDKLNECRSVWNAYATTRGTPSYETLFEKTATHKLTFFGSLEDEVEDSAKVGISGSPKNS